MYWDPSVCKALIVGDHDRNLVVQGEFKVVDQIGSFIGSKVGGGFVEEHDVSVCQ